MLVFIDESGDAGFKIQKGSSPYFVIVLVCIAKESTAEDIAKAIKNLKQILNKPESFEFKFNKCTKEIRLKFFECISPFNFKIRAIVFDKKNIYSLILRNSKEKFYNYAFRKGSRKFKI
jgi:hypothetical protein